MFPFQFIYCHIAHTGLFYVAKCPNKGCVAYGEKITIERGIGEFRPNEDSRRKRNIMNCPGCKTYVEKYSAFGCVKKNN